MMRWRAATAACSCAIVACVLVEPVPELPVPPPRRATIVASAVSPPLNVVVDDLAQSTSFVVPVEAEPNKTLRWRVFIDFGRDQALVAGRPDTDLPPIAGTSARRVVEFSLASALVGDPRVCHTITLFVAYDLEVTQTPKANDGDEVTWFYQPGGATVGCVPPDAGAPDAASALDASDGSTE